MYKHLIAILFTGSLLAQSALTLQEAVTLAMRYNHQIQVSRNDAQIAENNAFIGNAGLLPKLDLTAGVSYQDATFSENAGSFRHSVASTSSNARILATYTLFDGLGNIYRTQRLNTTRDLALTQTRAEVEGTLYQVASAFYNAALTRENLTIAQDLLAISEERYQRAKARNRFGQAGQIELLSAQVDLNTDSVTVAYAKTGFETAVRGLNVLLGRSPETPVELNPQVFFMENRDLDAIMAAASRRNAAFHSAQLRTRQARLDLNIAQSAHAPRIDLNTSYGYSQSEDDFYISMNAPNKTLIAGATVTLNLFNGFQTHIRRKNAALTLKNRQLVLEEAELILDKSIRDAYASYHQSRFFLDAEMRNLRIAELNFQRNRELFQLGQVTNTQFREAQLNLIRAKNRISFAKFGAKLNEIEILRLTGELIRNPDSN